METRILREQSLSQRNLPRCHPNLVTLLSQKVVGQSAATKPCSLRLHVSIGPGSGGQTSGRLPAAGTNRHRKNETVEAIGELLHRRRKEILKIDCASFRWSMRQPNLLGLLPVISSSRNDSPATSQQLTDVTSPAVTLALVLLTKSRKLPIQSPNSGVSVSDKAPSAMLQSGKCSTE